MNQTVKADLKEITLSLESIAKLLPKLTRAEKIDAGAHINTIKNAAEALDKAIKDEIEVFRREKAGEVKGELFKATLAYNDVTRLDQKALKEELPKTHADYCKTKPERRITYSLR